MGLFPHYPASSASVIAQADAIQATTPQVTSVSDSVTAAHQVAVGAVTGLLATPIAASVKTVTTRATSITQDAVFAGGCVRYWGDAIATYDLGIDRLNSEYDSAVADHFGLKAPSLLHAVLTGQLDEYLDDRKEFNHQVDTARTAMIATLTIKKNALSDTLDDEATRASGWLNAGPTDASLLALMGAGALPLTSVTLFPTVDFGSLDMASLIARLNALGRSSWLTPNGTSADLLAVLNLMRDDGVDPKQYADLLKQYWLLKACENAGIDLSGWDPSKGVDAMLPYLLASYSYYAKLFEGNPNFQWAGMAGMIGPTFAGGMFDLEMFRTLAQRLTSPLDPVPDELKNAFTPDFLKALDKLADLPEDEFQYFETSLLSMQKQIFTDQVPMHEAYLAMGMDGINEMRAAGLIDDATATAWSNIDYGSKFGDPDLVAAGNKQLLYREQHDIIGDDYNDMRAHDGDIGAAMTYLMGAIGDPGIPGAKTLAQHDPLSFGGSLDVPIPSPIPFYNPELHAELDVKTPLPAGNISDFGTRWDLIENDTLPAFQDLLKNHPDQVADILNTDVGDRIDDARLLNNLDDLLARLTDWDVDFSVGIH